ncbi:hypothetical protein RIF29_18751 [Crotalaria pallida]|uniref:FAR1 domain-containing protein n=1 Tax=Crotalaria pallida TaxID=3830 RepID=A0AAN9IAR4_CROPI
MRIYLQSTTSRWIVCYFNDQHNHQLLPGFGRIHRSQSKITEPDMEQVRSLRKVGIKMPHIYASFAERVGGYPFVGFKKKALYNRLHGENKDGVGHAALKYMRKSVSTDPGFVWKHVVDSDGSRDNLCEFVEQMERCWDVMRYNELDADFKNLSTSPVLLTPFKLLEKSAAEIYTREVFEKVQGILFISAEYKASSSLDDCDTAEGDEDGMYSYDSGESEDHDDDGVYEDEESEGGGWSEEDGEDGYDAIGDQDFEVR